MRIEILPQLVDNYAYLLICERTGKAAVIDPAEADPVLARVRELGVELAAVWNTHHHADHTAGNEAIARAQPVQIYGRHTDASRIWGHSVGLRDGDGVPLGELRATVMHTPGHTRGALVYVLPGAAFTGDTLFGAGCGRLFEGDAATFYASINQRIAGLPPLTRLYCGHEYTAKNLAFARTVEPDNEALRQRAARVTALRQDHQPSVPSTLAEELATNPFLRCDQASIRGQLAGRFAGGDFSDPRRVFAGLRSLRDRF